MPNSRISKGESGSANAPALFITTSNSQKVLLAGKPSGPVEAPASEASAISSRVLDACQAYSDGLGGSALLVWHDGRRVHERYAPGFGPDTRLKTYSMAKSVLGLAFGLAAARGVVDLNDKVSDHIEDWSCDPRGAITFIELLQMRSGLKLYSLARREPQALELVEGQDVARTALATPLVEEPGATFEYSNVNSVVCGIALERALKTALGLTYAEFVSAELWSPLGQAEASLEVEFEGGVPRFFAGLDACARDWLRLGELFISGGTIKGRQVVPKAWLDAMTTPSANPAYGLHMWLGAAWAPLRIYGPGTTVTVACKEPYLAPDLVFFDGTGGQRVYMVPSHRLIIVRIGQPSRDWDDSILPNLILRDLLQTSAPHPAF